MKEEELLTSTSLSRILSNFDSYLVDNNLGERSLTMIGGGAMMLLGMPLRRTEDIDLFGNDESNKQWLADASNQINMDFDPNAYRYLEHPYIQWVKEDFVHMPKDDAWKQNKVECWKGIALTLYRPPIGVILGSKLAAARDKDMRDIAYIASNFPDWQEQLDKYVDTFSPEDQEEIQGNLEIAKLFANTPNP